MNCHTLFINRSLDDQTYLVEKSEKFDPYCNGMNFPPSSNPYLEILTPNVMALEEGSLRKFSSRGWRPREWD